MRSLWVECQPKRDLFPEVVNPPSHSLNPEREREVGERPETCGCFRKEKAAMPALAAIPSTRSQQSTCPHPPHRSGSRKNRPATRNANPLQECARPGAWPPFHPTANCQLANCLPGGVCPRRCQAPRPRKNRSPPPASGGKSLQWRHLRQRKKSSFPAPNLAVNSLARRTLDTSCKTCDHGIRTGMTAGRRKRIKKKDKAKIASNQVQILVQFWET